MRKLIFSVGEFYHIYNRGVDKRIVFENDSDYRRFCLLLYLCNRKTAVRFDTLPHWKKETSSELIKAVFEQPDESPLVAIGAYCLMPNHYHILVKEIAEAGISIFMHKLSTAYTMYFNLSRGRTGSLFQGRFKAEHANTDRYLKYLFAYIHLNPVKLAEPNWKVQRIQNIERVKEYLFSYPYSSYFDFLGKTRELVKILNWKQFPHYFSKDSFIQDINDWLTYDR